MLVAVAVAVAVNVNVNVNVNAHVNATRYGSSRHAAATGADAARMYCARRFRPSAVSSGVATASAAMIRTRFTADLPVEVALSEHRVPARRLRGVELVADVHRGQAETVGQSGEQQP